MTTTATVQRPDAATGRRIAMFGFGGGLLAGLLAFGFGEGLKDAVRPPLQRQVAMGRVIMRANYGDQVKADTRNAVIAFAALGATLGFGLGAAGGLARRSGRQALRAGAVGFILGGVLTAITSFALVPLYFVADARSREDLSHDLLTPLLTIGGVWAVAGLVGGASFAFGLGGGRGQLARTALGGFVGAALGASLYQVLGAIAFPSSQAAVPIPHDWYIRGLARLLVAALAGLLAGTTAVASETLPQSDPTAN